MEGHNNYDEKSQKNTFFVVGNGYVYNYDLF